MNQKLMSICGITITKGDSSVIKPPVGPMFVCLLGPNSTSNRNILLAGICPNENVPVLSDLLTKTEDVPNRAVILASHMGSPLGNRRFPEKSYVVLAILLSVWLGFKLPL